MPDYTFDSTSNEHLSSMDDDHIENVAEEILQQQQQQQQQASVKSTQLKVTNMWKHKNLFFSFYIFLQFCYCFVKF